MLNNVMNQLKAFPDSAKGGASSAYRVAMNHPKTSAAVMLGTGVAAALLYLAKRNGGFAALHQEVMTRVKALPGSLPKRLRSSAET
jgi:hypothetical protein